MPRERSNATHHQARLLGESEMHLYYLYQLLIVSELICDLVQVRSSSTTETRVQGRGVISYPNQAQSDIFEISYKNHKTGKIRRWNLMESPFQEFPNGSYNQPGDVDSEVGSSSVPD